MSDAIPARVMRMATRGSNTCDVPSLPSPTGLCLHCALSPGHTGLHAWTSRAEDEDDGREHTYRWGTPPGHRG